MPKIVLHLPKLPTNRTSSMWYRYRMTSNLALVLFTVAPNNQSLTGLFGKKDIKSHLSHPSFIERILGTGVLERTYPSLFGTSFWWVFRRCLGLFFIRTPPSIQTSSPTNPTCGMEDQVLWLKLFFGFTMISFKRRTEAPWLMSPLGSCFWSLSAHSPATKDLIFGSSAILYIRLLSLSLFLSILG